MKISVITVNRNNREGLRKTLESVAAQTVRPFECIVIDGASTDGGAALLTEFAPVISWSVSEPDKGIYNAMNKGISHATGDWCLFMNSGDCFASDTVLASLEQPGTPSSLRTRPIRKPRRSRSACVFFSMRASVTRAC